MRFKVRATTEQHGFYNAYTFGITDLCSKIRRIAKRRKVAMGTIRGDSEYCAEHQHYPARYKYYCPECLNTDN